jgi:hypothetical protein
MKPEVKVVQGTSSKGQKYTRLDVIFPNGYRVSKFLDGKDAWILKDYIEAQTK